jgi:hypothetical protein
MSSAAGRGLFVNVALANSLNDDDGLRWGGYKFTSRPETVGIMCQEIFEKKRWPLVLSQGYLLLEHLTFYLVGGAKPPLTVPSVKNMTQLKSWEATTNLSSGCFIIAVPTAAGPGPRGLPINTQHQARGNTVSSADTSGNAAAAGAPGVPGVAAGGAGAGTLLIKRVSGARRAPSSFQGREDTHQRRYPP